MERIIFTRVRRKSGWLAIRVHADRIDLAHVQRNAAGRPEVSSLDSWRREGDLEEMLKRLRKDLKLGQYRCAITLNQGEYQLLQIDAPNVPREEMRDAVRWQVKDMLDYPPQSATLDVLDIPTEQAGAGRPKSIFVVAANNSVVAMQMQLFERTQIPLEVIDIPEMAQRNLAALYEEEERGLALLTFDETGGLLTFTYHGELYAMRRIEMTAEQLIHADAEQRQQHLERITLELQRSLDHFDRQYSFITLSRLLFMPVAALPGMASYLAANLYLPVQEMNLAEVLDFQAIPEMQDPARQAQCLQMIGLALRPDRVEAIAA